MKRFLPLASLALALAFLYSGCATTAASSENEAPAAPAEEAVVYAEAEAPVMAPPMEPSALNAVQMLDAELSENIKITKHSYSRTAGNTLRVAVTFKNLLGISTRIKARTQYFSDDRIHQEGPGEWTILYLPAYGIDTYVTSSLSENVGGYYVEVSGN